MCKVALPVSEWMVVGVALLGSPLDPAPPLHPLFPTPLAIASRAVMYPRF